MKKILAPVVGIFYRSGAPGDEAFVEVGDRVEVGDTVCILEAMKIFNEIVSDYAGVVTRIVPQNAELVAVNDAGCFGSSRLRSHAERRGLSGVAGGPARVAR